MVKNNLSTAYDALVADKKLENDAAQREVLTGLARMEESALKGSTLLERVGLKKSDKADIKGIYLWGHVGRGKSMLMDLYFHKSQIEPKMRVHFHNFMIDVHARIHKWRQSNPSELKTTTPIEPVAKAIAQKCRLLCLDELQVTDVADAMILEQLFLCLLKEGVKVVFTSNRTPEDLYQGGIQRERFMQFVRLVREQFLVLSLTEGGDYRTEQIRSLETVYFTPITPNNTALFNKAFKTLTSNEPAYPMDLKVSGRTLHVPLVYGGIARFNFADLCEKPLGAHDYVTLADHFHTIFIQGIPLLTPEKRNEARRFVTLIDALYERKVNLICTAAAPATELYPEGDGSFEFARTASRLVEMQSERYLEAYHQCIKIVEPHYAQV